MFTTTLQLLRTVLTTLALLLILAPLSALADKTDSCPNCVLAANQALLFIDELDDESRYRTFCRMHYETPGAETISVRELNRRSKVCPQVINTIKRQLESITNGGQVFISLGVLDEINRLISIRDHGVVPSHLIASKSTLLSTPESLAEFKNFSRELFAITNASWLIFIGTEGSRNCPKPTTPFNHERRYPNRAMESQRWRIFVNYNCDVISSLKLNRRHIPEDNRVYFAGLAESVSTKYLGALSSKMNRQILALMNDEKKVRNFKDLRNVNLSIIRFGQKVFLTQRYADGNTRTSLAAMNLLRLSLGLPPFQQDLLILPGTGVSASVVLKDYQTKITQKLLKNIDTPEEPQGWWDWLSSFYQNWLPAR